MPLPTLLVVIVLASGELASFELGPPLDADFSPEARVEFILADFDARTDLLWDMDLFVASQTLLERLDRGSLDPSSQIHLIRALGMVGIPLAADSVEKFITNPNPAIRLAVVRSLGQMAKFSTIPLIQRYLNDPDPQFRRAAVIALGKFGKTELIPVLETAAKQDPSLLPLVQNASRRITSSSTKNFSEFVDAVLPTDEYEDILPLLMFTWQPLVRTLSQKDRGPQVRQRAVRLLSLARVRRASQALTAIVADPQEPSNLRLQAVIALGRCRIRSSADQLIALLNSPDHALQDATITSLGQLGVPQALDPLLKKWNDRGGSLRERIRLALRHSATLSGTETFSEALANDSTLSLQRVILVDASFNLTESFRTELIDPWLTNPAPSVRRDAILLLAFLGGRVDAPKIHRMTGDPDPANRELADRALRRLRSSAQ